MLMRSIWKRGMQELFSKKLNFLEIMGELLPLPQEIPRVLSLAFGDVNIHSGYYICTS